MDTLTCPQCGSRVIYGYFDGADTYTRICTACRHTWQSHSPVDDPPQCGGVISRSNFPQVGEPGPELISLPGGAQVSRFAGTIDGPPRQVNIYLDGKKIAQTMSKEDEE